MLGSASERSVCWGPDSHCVLPPRQPERRPRIVSNLRQFNDRVGAIWLEENILEPSDPQNPRNPLDPQPPSDAPGNPGDGSGTPDSAGSPGATGDPGPTDWHAPQPDQRGQWYDPQASVQSAGHGPPGSGDAYEGGGSYLDGGGYPPEPDPAPGPSWEYHAEMGILRALGRTMKEVMTNPNETFRWAVRSGGMINPFLYALLMGSIFSVLGLLVSLVMPGAREDLSKMLTMLPEGDPIRESLGDEGYLKFVMAGAMIFLVINSIAAPLVVGMILHLFLMMTGARLQGFEATYRVVAYGFGSSRPLALIPFCGFFLVTVWSVVVYVVGLAAIHGIETWQALIAVLVPGVLTACCCAAIFFTLIGVAGALAQ